MTAERVDELRDALRIHHPIMRSETGPFSGCRCGAVRLGQDVIAHVVAELRAALAAARPPAPADDPLPARVADIEAALRARVQRVLGRRIGASAIQLTADLFQPGEGPLAELLATVREQADAIERARALADEWVARVDTYLVGLSLRAVLPADHGQDAREGGSE